MELNYQREGVQDIGGFLGVSRERQHIVTEPSRAMLNGEEARTGGADMTKVIEDGVKLCNSPEELVYMAFAFGWNAAKAGECHDSPHDRDGAALRALMRILQNEKQ